jgi:hypothetical protein
MILFLRGAKVKHERQSVPDRKFFPQDAKGLSAGRQALRISTEKRAFDLRAFVGDINFVE